MGWIDYLPIFLVLVLSQLSFHIQGKNENPTNFDLKFFVQFAWLVVCLTGLGFNGANLYGYIRCKLGGVDAIKSYANNFIGKQFLTRSDIRQKILILKNFLTLKNF